MENIQEILIILTDLGIFKEESPIFEPQEKVQKGETLIGVLNDFQKVLFNKIMREFCLLNKAIEEGRPKSEIIKLNMLHEIINCLLFASISSTYNLWTERGFLIKKGFKIVLGPEGFSGEENLIIGEEKELNDMLLYSNIGLYKS